MADVEAVLPNLAAFVRSSAGHATDLHIASYFIIAESCLIRACQPLNQERIATQLLMVVQIFVAQS